MTKQTAGKAMMVVGSAGAAGSVAVGFPANQDDWLAVLLQVLVAAVGAILNGKGSGK